MISLQKLVKNLNKMIISNLDRQHQRSLNSYFKSSWEYLYLFGVISYYFIQSILLQLVVWIFKFISLMFLYSLRQDDNFMSFVILTRRWHLDNTTFFCVSQTWHTKEGARYLAWMNVKFIVTTRLELPQEWYSVYTMTNAQDWSPHTCFILNGSQISTLQLKGRFKSKTSI